MGNEPATYAVQCKHKTLPLSHCDTWPPPNFRSFNVPVHPKPKNAKKNKINTDPNLTTNLTLTHNQQSCKSKSN